MADAKFVQKDELLRLEYKARKKQYKYVELVLQDSKSKYKGKASIEW